MRFTAAILLMTSTILSSPNAFSDGPQLFPTPEEAAVQLVQSSTEMQTEAKALCGGLKDPAFNAITVQTNDDSSLQVLVVETPSCAFLGPYLSVMVRVQRQQTTTANKYLGERGEVVKLPYLRHIRPVQN